jgi:hypothetical protein
VAARCSLLIAQPVLVVIALVVTPDGLPLAMTDGRELL